VQTNKNTKMALKNSITRSDFIPFEIASHTANKLLRDNKTAHIGRYIIIAINTGLRNSDIMKLTFDDMQRDTITIREKKTNKVKTIAINGNIRAIIPHGASGDMFLTRDKVNISIQHLNRVLKQVFSKEAKTLNISSHSLRKSFGRHVYESNNESDKILMLLSHLFNHSNTAITRTYLGLKQEELNNIYLSI
jgi:integrase